MNKYNVGDFIIGITQEGFKLGVVESVINYDINNPERFKILKRIECINKAIMFEDYSYIDKNSKVVWDFKYIKRCRVLLKRYENKLKIIPKMITKYRYLVAYGNNKFTEIVEEKSLHEIKNVNDFNINLKNI